MDTFPGASPNCVEQGSESEFEDDDAMKAVGLFPHHPQLSSWPPFHTLVPRKPSHHPLKTLRGDIIIPNFQTRKLRFRAFTDQPKTQTSPWVHTVQLDEGCLKSCVLTDFSREFVPGSMLDTWQQCCNKASWKPLYQYSRGNWCVVNEPFIFQ